MKAKTLAIVAIAVLVSVVIGGTLLLAQGTPPQQGNPPQGYPQGMMFFAEFMNGGMNKGMTIPVKLDPATWNKVEPALKGLSSSLKDLLAKDVELGYITQIYADSAKTLLDKAWDKMKKDSTLYLPAMEGVPMPGPMQGQGPNMQQGPNQGPGPGPNFMMKMQGKISDADWQKILPALTKLNDAENALFKSLLDAKIITQQQADTMTQMTKFKFDFMTANKVYRPFMDFMRFLHLAGYDPKDN